MADDDTISELVILKGSGVKTRAPVTKRLEQALGSVAVKRHDKRPSVDFSKFRPGPLLERAQVLERIAKKGVVLKNIVAGQPLTLSPRRPYVEGEGWLNLIQVRHVWGENGMAWWQRVDDAPDAYRSLEIWLQGITIGASYLVQIRVAGAPDGNFVVRGSDTTGVITVSGATDTIAVLVHEVDASLSLVTLHATNMWEWGLYDVTISAL
ncbi:hypothetical protein [Nannocystis radixulma]|uniref:Minor tail protein n=1 Tax=Nannocystis radixulma TaxID=2995305 RepID=A0ABT5AYS5_9BACT|nr:hypothetical protein [Nannocystis radixulma]MDC0666999.1 hypothetical protein [Nannocystis radixulma]